MSVCKCQSGHQADATLHTIFKLTKIIPAVPMMVLSVDESIKEAESENALLIDRCGMVSALTNRARLREDALFRRHAELETIDAMRRHWLQCSKQSN